MLKQRSDDPSTWSIEDVILFLKGMDPQMSDSVSDLFRQHVMYPLARVSCHNAIE